MLGPNVGGRLGESFARQEGAEQQLRAFLALVGLTFPKSAQSTPAVRPRPVPFSPGQAAGVPRNPLAALASLQAGPMGATSGRQLQGLLGELDQLIAMLSPQARGGSPAPGAATPRGIAGAPAAPVAPAATTGGMDKPTAMGGGGGWGNIDAMMNQANQLLQSDKQSDQLRGQMLMMKAMRLFEMISKMLEQQSQLASKAIQAIR